MPTKHPRLNVVLERPLLEGVRRLAHRDGISLSLETRDLIREALEQREDLALGTIAGERERKFERRKALSHLETWGRRAAR